MKHILILIGIYFLMNITAFGQLNKISAECFGNNFKDSLLGIVYCPNSPNCPNQWNWLILSWKEDGNYHFLKKKLKPNGKKVKQKLNKKEKASVIYFFENQIYNINGELENEKKLFIDDGSITKVYFKTKKENWEFSYDGSIPIEGFRRTDKRIIWINSLHTAIK